MGCHLSQTDANFEILTKYRRYLLATSKTFIKHRVKYTYSGTCVLWTPWDQPKMSRLSRCPDFPGQFI